MKFFLKETAFVVILFLVCFSAEAQEKSKTEVREVFVQIDSVYHQGDSLFAYINAGKNLGLENGLLVRVYTKWIQKSAVQGERDFTQAGFGWIRQTGNYKSIAVLELFNREGSLLTGDLVAINLQVPVLAYRSIFSDLALYNIEFRNSSRLPLYTLRDIWKADSKQFEDSLITLMIADIKETYELVKDLDGLESLKKPLVGSRFKGKSVFDVMKDVDHKAVMGYLMFVKYFPGKYIGGNMKGNETFATWVLNNAPYTKLDIKNALYPVYKDQAKLKKLLPDYQSNILTSKMVESLSEDAISLNLERKANEAASMLEFAKTLAYTLNDTAGKASLHLNYAQVLQDQGKYKEAISECDLSIKHALLSGKKAKELEAIMKKAYCHFKISEYIEAKKILASAEKKLEEYKSAITNYTYQTTLQKRYEYEGWIHNDEGNFDLALKYYIAATDINSRMNTYESRRKNAEYFVYIGRVFGDKGKQDKALEAYNKAAEFYFGIRDHFNYAKTLNRIAYAQYMSSQYRNSMATLDKAVNLLTDLQEHNEAGYSKSLAGSCYWELGKFDSAVIAHKQAIALRVKGNNKYGQAYSWKQIGELYELSGLKKDALKAFDTAANLYEQVKDLSGVAETSIKAGKVHYNDENYYKAAQYYEKARGVNNKTTVEALYNLGSAWSQIDKDKSKKYYLECKLKSDSTGNTSYSFYATKALASMAYRESDFEGGDKYFEECIKISNELNTPETYAHCHSVKGDKFFKLSSLDSSYHYYQKALSIYDTVSNESKIWQLITIANSIYISKGDFEKAEKTLLQSADMAKAANNNLALGYSLQSLSFLYALLGEVPKGLNANDSARAIFKRTGNVLRLADTYNARGSIYKVVGEYKKSIESLMYADSIYLAEKVNDYRRATLNNIGVTYYNQGDYKKAIDYFEQSAKFLPKNLINEEYLLTISNIAECYYYLKNVKEAKKIFLEAYAETEKRNLNRISSAAAIVLGRIFYDEGDLDKALIYFDEARKYSIVSQERSKLIESLTQLGKIDVINAKYTEAVPKFLQAVNITNEYNIASGWEALYEIGLMYFNQNNFDSSVTYLRSAVNLLNRHTENLYGDEKAKKIFNNDPRKADLYFKLSFAYSKIGKPEEAFAFANLSGLAGLKELGGGGVVPGFEKESEELEVKKQKANALRASAAKQTGQSKVEILKQLEVAEKDYTNYLMNLVQKDEKFNTYYPQEANPNSFLKYKGDLPDDVAVVLYLLNENNLMTFTLTNEALSIQVDSLNKEIHGLINAFGSLTRRPGKSTGTGALTLRAESRDEDDVPSDITYTDAADQLYKVLVASIYDKIKTKKKICIIPNGSLSNLPFQCLGQIMGEDKFKFFIEDHSIFYTNDISIFYKSRKFVPEKADLASFAAFGVPDATLKYNTREVKEIGKLIGVENAVYADNRATEGLAKSSLAEKKFIHFATHGILNYSQDFSKSYLKFLPDIDTSSGNNGQLTITEIQQLSLEDCDLVTLSACETAVNKQITQGWNISPANAFLLRRVKSVVASLWKVDDEATSILMNEFYTNLTKKMDKVDALRLAQVKLSQHPKYSHPFYWGAFVLYGEWR